MTSATVVLGPRLLLLLKVVAAILVLGVIAAIAVPLALHFTDDDDSTPATRVVPANVTPTAAGLSSSADTRKSCVSTLFCIFLCRSISPTAVWGEEDDHFWNFLSRGQSWLGPPPKKKKSSQNLILKLLEMLAISQFKARFQARRQI